MFVSAPISEIIPVSINVNRAVLSSQQFLTPAQTWASVQLASSIHLGISEGSEVVSPSFRKKILKLAHHQEKILSTKEMNDFEMWSQFRYDFQLEGKVDPSELPNMKAEAVAEGVKISWSPLESSHILRRREAIAKYDIYRDTYRENGKELPRDPVLIGTTTELSFIDRKAIKGSFYMYYVKTNSVVLKDKDIQNSRYPAWGRADIGWDRNPWPKP